MIMRTMSARVMTPAAAILVAEMGAGEATVGAVVEANNTVMLRELEKFYKNPVFLFGLDALTAMDFLPRISIVTGR